MTKSLEEEFNLPPLKEAIKEQEVTEVVIDEVSPVTDISASDDEPVQIMKALSVAEKIDHALVRVDQLDESDSEMDELAKEALEAYAELKDLAMNMSDAHSGRMMEVAASMLRTSLDAKSAKIDRKLKTIDLQIKKMRMDRLSGNIDSSSEDDMGIEFDRNELLRHIITPTNDE